MSRFRCSAVAAVVVLGLAAPAVGGPVPTPTGEVSAASEDPVLQPLRERVLAYWQARVRKDSRSEYELLEPRARARLAPEEYGRGRTVEYLAAQVEGVERRGNFARVAVRLLVKVAVPLPVGARVLTESTLLPDLWVLIGGTWYRSEEADAGVPGPWPVASP